MHRGGVIGRTAELAEGERFLDALAEGPAALVIRGEAGIGKSSIWGELVSRAGTRGYRPITCRPARTEVGLAFVGLADLLDDMPEAHLAALPHPQRRALEVALLREDPGAYATDWRAVGAGLRSILGALCAEQPVVLGIDDAQWLDRATSRALEYASHRITAESLGLLVSVRARSGEPAPLPISRSFAPDRVSELEVGPLSVGALYQLIRERLHFAVSRPEVLRVEETSAGNPLYALEIARALAAQGVPALGEPLPLPASLGELVASRIRSLPGPTRDALLVASALSRPTTELVDPQALTPALDEEVVTVLDGRIEFTHPLFAAATYGSASPSRRQRLHRELAERVTDPEDRARHLTLSTEGPDEDVALALDQAAEQARRRGAPDVAAEFAHEAARRTKQDEPGRLPERLLGAARHSIHAGDYDRARRLAHEILDLSPPPVVRADALLVAAETCYGGYLPDAVPLLEEALPLVENDLERQLLVRHSLAFVCMATGMLPDFERHTDLVTGLAQKLGDAALKAEAIGLRCACDFLLGRGFDDDALRRALELEDPERHVPVQMRPSMLAAWLYHFTGRFDDARALLLGLRRRITDRGDESDAPFVLVNLATLEHFAGASDAAAVYAEDAVASAALVRYDALLSLSLGVRALVGAARGDLSVARSDALEALRLADHTRYVHGAFGARWALATVALIEDDATSAWDVLAPVIDAVEAVGVYDRASGMYVPDAVEALVTLGDIARADRLTSALEETGRRLDRPWARALAGRCRGLILAAERELDRATAALEEALTEHERLGVPLDHGRTQLTLGRVLRRRRQKRAAAQALTEALTTFEAIGAHAWAAKARHDLGRVGLRRSAPDALTETEQRVAELAAEGLRNREIAARAFLTPKSVEDVLSRVYRKLGIHSRAELGARMATRIPD